MHVGEIITQAQRLAGRVDPGFDSRALRFINEGVEHWARKIPWPTIRRVDDFVANGTRELILPAHVMRVVWLADKTNSHPIAPLDPWDREYPTRYMGESTGQPDFWREEGVTPVTAQPAAPATIEVVTTASDSFSVHLAGYVRDTTASGTANYEVFAEEILAVGGTGTYSSANQYVRLMSIGKDDVTAGDLLVYNAGTLISRVHKNRYVSEYRRIEFLQIPTGGTLIRTGYLERPPPLTLTTQHPHPAIDPDYLIWWTAGLIHHAQNQKDMGDVYLARAEMKLQDRIYAERSHGDRDQQGIPDQGYWDSESQYSWP